MDTSGLPGTDVEHREASRRDRARGSCTVLVLAKAQGAVDHLSHACERIMVHRCQDAMGVRPC